MASLDASRGGDVNPANEIKEKIIEAASLLYEKKGLYDTSVEEIAAKAGVSIPVTYHHVTKKSDILLLIMEAFTQKFKNRVKSSLEETDDVREQLKKAIKTYYELVNEEAVKVVLVYRKSRELDKNGRSRIMADEIEHITIFEKIIIEGIKRGVFIQCDANLAAYNILMSGHTWALKPWHFKKRLTLHAYIKEQTDFILNALNP